ncbi:cytochrome c oxidase assembly protein [Ammoniphilus resinae]|uniref:Membrane protein n=1 Tax=Ammoniphilus resinae TaxID=861532 RepID=A0ABS4GX60_9BACL|nr:cytochrome c oxidase assembly protein [Ammoniphilus resinae]MBP1934692.1 putative membrane protein [Ammoniphilus resinae]
MIIFQTFSFAHLWSPWWIAVTVIIAVAYAYFILPGSVSGWRMLSFYSGLFLFYLAVGGPIDLLGHFLFFMHMIKMAILYIIVPPLVIMGLPNWFYMRYKRDNRFMRVLGFFSRPILANVMFATLFSIYHMPYIFDLSMTNLVVKTVYTTVLFISAVLVWWPLLSPIPSHQDLSAIRKIGYLYLGAFLLSPSCALIVFGNHPIYATYTDPQTWATALGLCISGDPATILHSLGGPQFLGGMTPLEDQKIGGVLMKITQEIVYGAALAFTFYRWAHRERAKEPEQVEEPGQGLGGPKKGLGGSVKPGQLKGSDNPRLWSVQRG